MSTTTSIYERPADYDLEHLDDRHDVEFYQTLALEVRPGRVLELACGDGRVSLPLAATGAKTGFDVVGIDISQPMLREAARKRAETPQRVQARLTFLRGDMRSWRSRMPFDLVLAPGSSLCHLLSLDDQIATWRQAWVNLNEGGRFVVDVATADFEECASAGHSPLRARVEMDVDATDPTTGRRLMRYKTSRYFPDEQRAEVHFIYDRFTRGKAAGRCVTNFDAHVYFPRELSLLFLHTGFVVEGVYGDPWFGPLRGTSSQMIVIGRKPIAPIEDPSSI